MQPRCKNLGAKGSMEARHFKVAPAPVAGHLGVREGPALGPPPSRSPGC